MITERHATYMAATLIFRLFKVNRMKIICRGEIKEKEYQAHCKNCKSLLGVTRSDGVIIMDRNEAVLKIKCPVCSGDVWVVV